MNKKYPFKQAIITGLVAGTFAVCAFIIADGLNKKLSWGVDPATIRGVCGLLTLMILGTGIYIGMRSVKSAQGNTLTYGQALLSGVIVAVTTGILTAVIGCIYTLIINPGYADYMVAEGRKAMLAAHESQADMARHTTQLKAEFSTAAQVMQAIVGQSVCGTVISLMMAAFIKAANKKLGQKRYQHKTCTNYRRY